MGLVHDDGATTDVPGMGTYANVYWAFGGGHRQLVRFDFESDHGPGMRESGSTSRLHTRKRLLHTRSPKAAAAMHSSAASQAAAIVAQHRSPKQQPMLLRSS